MTSKNRFEKAWEAMSEAHRCNPIGYLLGGRLDAGHLSVTVCDTPACMEVSRAYVEAAGYGPATLHEYPTRGRDVSPPKALSLFETVGGDR